MSQNNLTIIGKRSPEFVADAIVDGKIIRINSLDFYGKYVLFFFYESDFSFVCPTEMLALAKNINEFKKRNVEVVTASVDSIQAHAAWLKIPQNQGGIQGFPFTMLSDLHKDLSRAYYILDEKTGRSLRGTFIVDPYGIVQYGSVHNYGVGRNTEELLRVIDAIQFTQKHGELCPLNWKPGQPGIKP